MRLIFSLFLHNGSIGEKANSDRKSTQAAKTMSLFVLVFFIQWWAAAVYGIWMMAAQTVPFAIFLLVTSFSNIGGILNGIVFLIMRKNKFRKSAPKPTVVCVPNTEATEVN